ncbi:MAG: DUF2079 domain-containing protein [Nocardioidaceae bacterium]
MTTTEDAPAPAGAHAYPAATRAGAASRLAPYAVGGAALVVYCTMSLARLHRLASQSWDVAIFEQAIRGYAHLSAPIVDVEGPGYNFFGDHFSPALAVFAPFYRLFPSAATLLVGQALLIAASVVVVTRLALRRVGTAAGVVIGASYAVSWGVQSAVNFDFHEVALATPLLALAGAAFVERDWRRVVLFAAPLVLVKEDLALTAATIGLVVALAGGRRYGVGLLLGSIGAFLVETLVVIPAYNPEGVYNYWPQAGAGPGLLGRLWGLPHEMVSPTVKVSTLLLVVAVSALLALRSPWLLVAVPNLVIRFVSDNQNYWSTDWHYSLTTMTVVFVALVDGIARARRRGPDWLRRYAVHAPAAVGAVALVLCMQFPFRTLLQPSTYAGGPRATHAQQVLAMIPDGTSVVTDIGLITPLVAGHTVYWVGRTNASVTADYVLLDDSTWGGQPPAVVSYAEQLQPAATYRLVYDAGGFQLAQRVG